MNSYIGAIINNKEGKPVVFQKPNWPVYVVVLLLGGRAILDIQQYAYYRSIMLAVACATMMYWAYLEISEGASLFRRVAGLAVGVIAIYLLFNDINGFVG